MDEYDYIIYTCGICDNYTGIGKWIGLITKNKKIIKIYKDKKNNCNEPRIQLIAIANTLSKIQDSSKVLLICDSQYATNAIQRNWYTNWINNNWKTKKDKTVQNKDIWKYLKVKLSQINIDVRWYQDFKNTPLGIKMLNMI